MGKLKKNIYSIGGVLLCCVVVIITSSIIFNGGFVEDKYDRGMEYYKGEVIEIINEDLSTDMYLEDIQLGIQELIVEINEGPYKNQQFKVTNPISRLYNYKVEEGTKIILSCYLKDNEVVMSVYNYKRSHMLYILIIIFVLFVVIIGGVKGVKSLVALLFTLVCCIYLMIPLMLKGISPSISSIVISILSICVTLILVSGINKKTLSAILGTTLGIIIAGVLAYVFGSLTSLSGINMEEAESLMYIAENTGLQVKGIMFAGILIASLGAVMDVAMSISSSIFELYSHNNKISIKSLFVSGMNIGKDIIGTMTNTLILAFVGGSMGTLILIFSAEMPYNKLINLDILGIELIQGLAGSIGVVLAVPLTAIISSYLCKNNLKK